MHHEVYRLTNAPVSPRPSSGTGERREALSSRLSPSLPVSLYATPVLPTSLPVPLHRPDNGLPSDADLQPTDPKNLVIGRRCKREGERDREGVRRMGRRKGRMHDTGKKAQRMEGLKKK